MLTPQARADALERREAAFRAEMGTERDAIARERDAVRAALGDAFRRAEETRREEMERAAASGGGEASIRRALASIRRALALAGVARGGGGGRGWGGGRACVPRGATGGGWCARG